MDTIYPEKRPSWATGTDITVVYNWEFNRYCAACFLGLCEICEGGPGGDGIGCRCDNPEHAEEYTAVE